MAKKKPDRIKRRMPSGTIGVPSMYKHGVPKRVRQPDGRRPTNAFNTGNEVWRQRSKHGRDKLFATPELMAEAAYEYFKWCDEHPMQRAELVKTKRGGYKQMEVSVRRPYTLPGVCLYMGATSRYLHAFKQQKRKDLAEFIPVINAIEETVANQQIEGALSGFFNSNLTSRINNLAETTNMNHGIQPDQVAALFPFAKPKELE